MIVTEEVTEYAAIHPAFEPSSLIHAWTQDRETAVVWATRMSKELGRPVRVSARITTTRREYLADSICE